MLAIRWYAQFPGPVQAQAARAHQAQTQARAAQQPPPQAQPPQSASVVPPTVAPPPAAAAQATPAPPPKSAAPTPNPKTVPIPLADIPTTPGGYKISQVATRAPVMSKTREGIWKVKGKVSARCRCWQPPGTSVPLCGLWARMWGGEGRRAGGGYLVG